jgi:hypothetical protein
VRALSSAISSGVFFTKRPHQPTCSSSSARLTTVIPIRKSVSGVVLQIVIYLLSL